MYCQGQEALGLSESERTSSEEPRAAVSVCQTMGVLDTAYGILYDFFLGGMGACPGRPP